MSESLARSPKPEKGIPPQTYKQHVSGVMRLATSFAGQAAAYSRYGPLLQDVVGYAAEYHDLGKLDEKNQEVLKTGKGKLPIAHWDAGTAHLLSYSKRLPNLISAFLVTCHHRGLLSLPVEQVKGPRMFREPAAMENTETWLARYLSVHSAEIGNGGVFASDWKGKVPTPLFMRIALSCLVDADHTDSALHCGNAIPEGEVPLAPGRRLAALDSYISSLPTEEGKRGRNELRQRVYETCRTAQLAKNGLIACDSPVGTGKTTAVMAHLLNAAKQKGLRRVFVVLPFTNIIDQSVEVYRNALVLNGEKSEKAVAAHHHKAEFEEEENRIFSFLWNAPITVTTAVQFFETLASNHPSTLRRLHQLAGSAIFIDEAHAALPAHLWPQAWKWLQELVKEWGCYIVMASGSLTRFWELEEFSAPPVYLSELVEPGIRGLAMDSEGKRVAYHMKDEPLSLEELCSWVSQLPGPRLVILNTVQSAAVVAQALADVDQKNRKGVEHLSTSLAPIDRKAVIARVKERLGDRNDTDWTLVATSCVEAGVDFSFRSAARELCSFVSTIQTAGRVNRSGEFGTCELWSFKIRPNEMLKEHPGFAVSRRILADFHRRKLVSPENCKEAMRQEMRDLNKGQCGDDFIVKDEMARKFPEVCEKFQVIASDTIAVVIDDDLLSRLEDRKRRKDVESREIQQKTVNIYSHKAMTYGVAPIDGFNNLYRWSLKYDDFLGYMAGVITIVNFTDNCCI